METGTEHMSQENFGEGEKKPIYCSLLQSMI